MFPIILAGIAAFLAWFYFSSRLPENFPPGPRFPFPVIGDSWYLGANLVVGIRKLKQNFGPVCGLYFGPARAVVISDFDLLQEAFSKDVFADRPNPKGGCLVRPGRSIGDSIPGVLFSSGRTWTEQRRFSLSTLRDLGYGKNAMESLVEEEMSDLLSHIEAENSGVPVNVQNMFNIASLNSLWRIFTGERLDRDDPKMKKLLDLMNQLVIDTGKVVDQITLEYYIPTLISKTLGTLSLVTSINSIVDFSKPAVAQHRASFQEDSIRDFVDAYIKEQKNAPPGSTFHGYFGDSNLSNIFVDFFIAGSETTSTTLKWAILFMANYPEIQKRVQEELDEVSGRSKFPEMSDKARTPFTEAVLLEIQRRGNIATLGVPHWTKHDTTVGDYFIPGDTMVFGNLGDIMHDPKTFPDPFKFDPTRYLSKDGSAFVPNPKVIPFGTGKRRCLGENLAKMSLYRFFTGLMHRFNIERCSAELISEEPVVSVAQGPQPYEIKFIPRN